jgi:CheY-like chemotaxis protein
MKILIAEDESDIGCTYKLALENNGHEVIVTENGEECLNIYRKELRKMKTRTGNNRDNDDNKNLDSTLLYPSSPFDAVVLDYIMPKKDGMEVAKEIFDLNPKQRIIFASAYVRDTLEDSVKHLKRVVELLQKPFDPDTLIDTIEDREAYEGLKKIMIDVKQMSRVTSNNFTQEQIGSLFDSLRKIQKGRSFMYFILCGLTTILQKYSMESPVQII